MWRSAHDWCLRGDALAVGTQPSPVAATLQRLLSLLCIERTGVEG
jgi:hypothetical protein